MSPSSRKRSRDDSTTDKKSAIESSTTVVGDADQARVGNVEQANHDSHFDPGPTIQAARSSINPQPTPTQDGMPEPTLVSDVNVSSLKDLPMMPSSTMGPPKSPRSGQIAASQQESQAQPQKPAKAKKAPKAETDPKARKPPRVDGDSKSRKSSAQAPSRKRSSEHLEPETAEESDSDASNSLGEPGGAMRSFDWEDLQLRHNQKMSELDQHEAHVMTEFAELSEFFGVWADASRTHEVGRSFKRMKTQFALVQHHEKELETKRQHYTTVYNAFKSAFDLLN